jgi:hypothetical protein
MDMNRENKDLERQSTMDKAWKSCCFSVSPIAVKFFIQVVVLGGLIISSVVMIIVDKECNSQKWYSGLLTLCLGVFLPAPRMQ